MIDYSAPLNVKLRKDNAFKSPLFLVYLEFVYFAKIENFLLKIMQIKVKIN